MVYGFLKIVLFAQFSSGRAKVEKWLKDMVLRSAPVGKGAHP
jgi:hypothetical protein